ncbi:MAG TPA: hypothetical protein PK794_04225, partial [Armatimonadota bacterium]|nr:hypothetical protein [Armatimonadota bacterium]
MDSPFTHLADQVTDGLTADPELRLDVRAEILAHLEDAAEHADGTTPEERAAAAIHAFGAPVEVAAQLLDANARRMAWRARLRLLTSAALIPLAVVVAVALVYGRFARAQNVNMALTGLGGAQSAAPLHFPELPWMTSSYAEYLRRQQANPEPVDTRAYWEKHRGEPESAIYFAVYACQLPRDREDYVNEMRVGESLEPENALYNYLLAGYYLQKAMLAQSEQVKKKGEALRDVLYDARLMELGIAEYLKGTRKPYYSDHSLDAQRQRVLLLPKPVLTEDYLFYTTINSTIDFPQLAAQRTLARKIGGCMRLLAAGGHADEARVLAHAWKRYASHLTTGAETLIHLLVAIACANIVANESALLYDAFGQEGLAADTRRALAAFNAPKEKRKKDMPPADRAYIRRYGSLLLPVSLPAYDVLPSVAEMAPARHLEHIWLETVGVNWLLITLTGMLLLTLTLAAFWYAAARRAKSVPFLLLPSWRALARVIGWGVVLP